MSKSIRRLLAGSVVLLLMLSALLFSVSCTSSIPQELSNNEKLWKDQGLTNYDFTLARNCFCPEDIRGPVNIQVRNGAAVNITYVDGGANVTGGKFDHAGTIDKLFTILKDAYAGKNEFNQKAYSVNVTYDSRLGYPVDFYIDVSQTTIDEEQGYTVTNFAAR